MQDLVLTNVAASYKTAAPGSEKEYAIRVPSLNFGQSRVTTVLGLNGSGKSTLLKAMLNMIAHEGTVRYGGDELSALSHKRRARILSYLPQRSPVPDMTVETLVRHGRFSRLSFGRAFGQQDKRAVEDALSRAGIAHLRSSLLRDLSGGEQQLAHLAMVMAQDARFMLLDEPFTYMDVCHQTRVMALLKDIARSGTGVVLTSHDLPQAFTHSDAVCILHHGTVAAYGPADQVARMDAVLSQSMGVTVTPVAAPGLLYRYAVAQG